MIFKTAIIALAILAATSCAMADEGPAPAESAESAESIELIRGPLSEDGLQAIFATPDLGVGKHRVAFALTSKTGLVDAPSAAVQSFYEPDDDALGEPTQTALAIFRPFPLVERGLYSTRLTFDRPGRWGIQAAVLGEDGQPKTARLFFDVPRETRAPAAGSRALPSANRTLDDVASLSQLTTGSMQDADLYRLTIAQALENDLPTVIVMASPAFCTNAVCGPQVEVLRDLKDEFEDEANFIHVDYYDNPEEIQGDLSRAIVSPTVLEWGLPSSEWSFVIDKSGVVLERFEGFATLEELRQSLTQALES